jgi:DNA repair protein RecN (Recombination protein N)
MLRELSIRNFAIIDDLSITFNKGLSVLTGETGAGKSIIIKAVDLILGGRASSDLIRSSEETAELEALFEVPPDSRAARVAQEKGFDLSEGLLIRRLIQRKGRHQIYINGRMATTQILASMNVYLASIAGQHSHQALLKPEYHLFVLDQFGDLSKLREKVVSCYQDILPLIKQVAVLRRQRDEQSERCELLTFQAKEIKHAQIILREDEQLEKERQCLKHAERLFETVGRCVELLYGLDGSVVEALAGIGKELQSLSNIDGVLAPFSQRIQNTSFELEDIVAELRNYMQRVVYDADRLEAVEQRLDMLENLKRKYGGSLDSVIIFGEKAEKDLERVSSLPEAIDALETELARLHKKLGDLCVQLSRKRRQASKGLAESVQQGVVALGMTKTRFDVQFIPVPCNDDTDPHLVWDGSGIEATGIDRVEFLVSPNVGEELRPLARIASGGELSRFILALKAILATNDAVETLIFDEVDSGIGGGVAEMVGKKLASLARFHQVLCITHLPHIACFGKSHFKIVKRERKGRTHTTIAPVQGEDRIKELARMLGGVRITQKTLAHAREMMTNSQ